MATQTVITTQTIQGVTYYQAERNGVAYMCYFTGQGEWCVQSQRLSLGRRNVGTFRHYKNLDLLASSIKAFSQLPQLLQVPTAVTLH